MKRRLNILLICLGLFFVTGILPILAYAEAITGDIQVNTGTISRNDPSVAMDSIGNFVITWSGTDGSYSGVNAQMFDSSGNPVGSEFQVNTYTTDSQSWPIIAMDQNGNFVITWMSYEQDGSYNGVDRYCTMLWMFPQIPCG